MKTIWLSFFFISFTFMSSFKPMTSEPAHTSRLGDILVKAHLISLEQLQIALAEQAFYTHKRLGDILVEHGWIHQKTADFFVNQWPNLLNEANSSKKRIGEYLIEAGLLAPEQIQEIMQEQQNNRLWRRFGAIVALKGWVPMSTVDLFLTHLFPEYAEDSPFTKPKQTKLT